MKTSIKLLCIIWLFGACEQPVENKRGIPGPERVEAERRNGEEQMKALEADGYQTFAYEQGDSTYLMQQYYLVFLKEGPNRDQDSTEASKIQEEHLAHLTRMGDEGFVSLAGPVGEAGEIKGIVVYNTPSEKQADSLAKLDPAVQAGRLVVEVHPWWTAKGGKLQ